MLVFLEVQIPQRLFRAASDAFRAGELGHQQTTAAKAADHAPKERVGNAGHGGEDRRGPDREVANFVRRRNHGTSQYNNRAVTWAVQRRQKSTANEQFTARLSASLRSGQHLGII